MAVTKDAAKTIKPRFNFTTSVPVVGFTEGQHIDFNPASGIVPVKTNDLSASKYNEYERAISEITDYLGDMNMSFGDLTVGSKIRSLENLIVTSGLASQLFYVMCTTGMGILPGDLNDNNYINNVYNGRFDISTHSTTVNRLLVQPGGMLSGTTTSDSRSVTLFNVTGQTAPFSVSYAPLYTIGTIAGTNPATWSGGELHAGEGSSDLTLNDTVYLEHRFLVTRSMEYTTPSIYATVVAVKEGETSTYTQAGTGTFSVELTTGRIQLGEYFKTHEGQYRFYYKHYGWRIDTIFIDAPVTDTEPELSVSAGTAFQDITSLASSSLPSITGAYSDKTRLPLYLIIVTPLNNGTENGTLGCTPTSNVTGCAYAKQLSTDENIIDIRRFISFIRKGRRFTNGLTSKVLPLINIDSINDHVLLRYRDDERTDTNTLFPQGYPTSCAGSRKLLVIPDTFNINDLPVRTQTKVIELDSIATDKYQANAIDLTGPGGTIVITKGDLVESTNYLSVTAPTDPINKTRIATAIVNGASIINIIPGRSSNPYIRPITGIGTIDVNGECYITHNIGTDYVAYAIPLERPREGATLHINPEYLSNNVTRFVFSNPAHTLKFLYSIIPTYNTSSIIPASSLTRSFWHGGTSATPTVNSIMWATSVNSYITNIANTNAYLKNTLTIATTANSSYSIKSAVIIDDIVRSRTLVETTSNTTVLLPSDTKVTKNTGIVLNFTFTSPATTYVPSMYWLDYNPASNIVNLKFKTASALVGTTGRSYVEVILLK